MQLDPQNHDRLIINLAKHLRKQSGQSAQIYRTHISSVIACGQYAYKCKRPIKLPFADFSTLELRQHDCLRELSINRRTAPDIYLDVIPISGSVSKPRLEGSGATLDWAVKMRRFKQSALLSHLITRDKITRPMACALGQHLARFGSALPRLRPEVTAKHRPVIDWLLESLSEISSIFPEEDHTAQKIASWAKRRARQQLGLIEQRRQEGKFRDCHGDLHLGNLVKQGATIVAFDALEFNYALSQIDILNDIAFAFMDLLAHDRADLAWAMMNQWCEQTADYDGLPLLRYYTLYRAVVRAKVQALTQRQANHETFKRYWFLAKRLISPSNPPRLILVAGLSGSGKSTVATDLVNSLSGIQIRADVIRKQLFADRLHDPAKLYARQVSRKVYARLAQIANQLLTEKMTVIVDATFLAQADIDRFNRLATKHNTHLHLLWCEAPIAVLERRIQRRAKQGLDPSDATVDVLHKQIARLNAHPIEWPTRPHRIDTHGTLKSVTAKIERLASKLLRCR